MMDKNEQIEETELTEVNILANDLNQHCADLAETYCGGINCLTCLAHALTAKGYRKASEVAREIEATVEAILNKMFEEYAVLGQSGCAVIVEIIWRKLSAELKKKYTEGEHDPIKIVRKPCEVFRAECPHCFAILEYDIYEAAQDSIQCPCCSSWFTHRAQGMPIRESEDT